MVLIMLPFVKAVICCIELLMPGQQARRNLNVFRARRASVLLKKKNKQERGQRNSKTFVCVADFAFYFCCNKLSFQQNKAKPTKEFK